MTTRTGPRPTFVRAAGAVATALALVLLAACGSSSPSTTAGGGTSPHAGHDTHTGHDTSAAIPAPQPLRPGERFVNLAVAKPYTPSPPHGGTDDYRCQVIDPQLTAPTFLTGTQFQPQNAPIAHHAIVFAIPPEQAAAARAQDAASGGLGWTCFGDLGLDTQQQPAWVDSWTPGGTETLLPHDVGYRLEPGSLLILQVHYNLLATDGHPAGTDQSSVRLRLTDGTPATQPLDTLQLMAPIELPCAAGESGPLCDRSAAVADVAQRFGPEVGDAQAQLLNSCSNGTPQPGNTQHCDIPVPQPVTVYATFGHMHLLGRSIKVELNPDTPHAQTLLDVPAFDFDDQKLQPLPTPVDLQPGDTVRVTCTHDATLRGQLPQLSKLPPRYVVWGDGTSDEMCLALLTATVGDDGSAP